MKVLIIAEKPSLAREIIASIQRTTPWPGAEVTVVMNLITGHYRFAYPAELKAADFPFVGNANLRPGAPTPHGMPVKQGICGSAPADLMYSGFHTNEELTAKLSGSGTISPCLRELLSSSDIVVDMTDNGPRGAVSFYNTISLGGTVDPNECVPGRILSVSLSSLRKDHLDRVTKSLGCGWRQTPDSDVSHWTPGNTLLLNGQAKDFFDFNWSLNARSLLAAPLGKLGPLADGKGDLESGEMVGLLSKYALCLVLHLARDYEPGTAWTDGSLAAMMSQWAGTGKHGKTLWHEFGSPMSRADIIENLCRLAFIERKENLASTEGFFITLTERGQAFAGLLPKSAMDADLPFRLDNWCSRWPNSRPEMETYLRRFFGAIKRTNGMADLVEGAPSVLDNATALVSYQTIEAAAEKAQVAVHVIRSALDGREITPHQARAIGLATMRLVGNRP